MAKAAGVDRAYLAHTSTALIISKGSQDRSSKGRNLETGAGAEATDLTCGSLACYPLMALPAFL